MARRKWEDTGSVKLNLLGKKFGDVDCIGTNGIESCEYDTKSSGSITWWGFS